MTILSLIATSLLAIFPTTLNNEFLEKNYNETFQKEVSIDSSILVNVDYYSSEYFNEKEYFYVDEIKDVDGQKSYLEVTFTTGGYYIYGIEKNIVSELSYEAPSPYSQHVNSEKVYGGPFNYYVLEDNELIEIVKEVEEEVEEEEHHDHDHDHEQIHGEEEVIEEVAEEKTNNLSIMPMAATTNAKKLSRSFYFEKLTTNFGKNYYGSCTQIAIQILSGYYDTFFNDNIIAETYDVAGNGSSSTATSSPGSSETFHQYLIDLGAQRGYYQISNNNYAMSYIEMVEMLKHYYNSRTINYTTRSILNNPQVAREQVKIEIDNDRPVIAVGDWSHPIIFGRHAFLIYGYNNNFFEVHTGLKNANPYKLSINESWVDSYLAFEYKGQHICSNNYINSSGAYCPCLEHFHSLTYTQVNGNVHKSTCWCGETKNQTHDFLLIPEITLCICGARGSGGIIFSIPIDFEQVLKEEYGENDFLVFETLNEELYISD